MASPYVNKSYLEKLEIFPKNLVSFWKEEATKKEPPEFSTKRLKNIR